jgi:hypothetical protein
MRACVDKGPVVCRETRKKVQEAKGAQEGPRSEGSARRSKKRRERKKCGLEIGVARQPPPPPNSI